MKKKFQVNYECACLHKWSFQCEAPKAHRPVVKVVECESCGTVATLLVKTADKTQGAKLKPGQILLCVSPKKVEYSKECVSIIARREALKKMKENPAAALLENPNA